MDVKEKRMKNYLKIRVDGLRFDFIESYESFEAANENKKSNENIWEVEDIQTALDELNKHNHLVVTAKVRPTRPEPPNHEFGVTIWDWSKVDDSHKEKINHWFDNKEWSQLMTYHNEKKLTADYYCCTSYERHIILNIEKARGEGIL